MSDDFEIIEKTTPFQGYFRIDRYVLRYRTFDGGWSEPATREVFERGHAAAVLLYDPERDAVGLIEQFRPGAITTGFHPWLIETVAGIIEEDEPPSIVAVREVKEEAGIEIQDLVHIAHYMATPGGSSETVRLYCACIDSTNMQGIHGLPEEGEDIRAFAVPADEAIAWVRKGKIINATTIIALQWLELNRETLKKRWTA